MTSVFDVKETKPQANPLVVRLFIGWLERNSGNNEMLPSLRA